MGYGTPLKKTSIQPGGILVGQGVAASLTTALTGTNNDLVFTARDRGTAGNSTTISYVVSGANTALAVTVTGTAISVAVATNGSSAATSTAAQIAAAVLASPAANGLVLTANAASNDGTGVVVALSATALSGGADYVRGPRTGGIGPSSDYASPVKRAI